MDSVFLVLCFIALPEFLDADVVERRIDHGVDLPTDFPLVIAHRGASGIFPEHTVEAYKRAILDGADVIECDVQLTRDLIPVCLHDEVLSVTTNVEDVAYFQGKNNSYSWFGKHDWFVIDFTFAELQNLGRIQQYTFRDQSYNNLYQIVTLQEYIDIAKSANRPVGIYPETKVPAFYNRILRERGVNSTFEDAVLGVLEANGYRSRRQPCFLQSFDEQSLLYMKNKTELPLVMLRGDGIPNDATLQRWAQNFYGVGFWKDLIVRQYNESDGSYYKNSISEPTYLLNRSHELGLKVHLYTFRNEDRYLPWDFYQDPILEYDFYLKLGVDGLFTDFSHTLARYMGYLYEEDTSSASTQTGSIILLASVILFVNF